jgi:hypothetical protein
MREVFLKDAIAKKFYDIVSRGKFNSQPIRHHYKQIFKVIKVLCKKLTAVCSLYNSVATCSPRVNLIPVLQGGMTFQMI